MIRFIVLLTLALLFGSLDFSSLTAPVPRRRGWLDDDDVPRGGCWDGSWLSDPRAA